MFPHEFLYLVTNAKARHDVLIEQKAPKLTIEKKSIKAYEMEEVDAKRLDWLYDIDTDEMKQNQFPIYKMHDMLNAADGNKKIVIKEIKEGKKDLDSKVLTQIKKKEQQKEKQARIKETLHKKQQ